MLMWPNKMHLPGKAITLLTYMYNYVLPLMPIAHSIRAQYGTNARMNAVHGSDSSDSAAR